MEILIEYGKTKRKISGSFNLCGSGTDLKKLANLILQQVEEKFAYGWIHVCDRQESVTGPSEEWE